MALPTPWFWTLRLQNNKRIHFCHFKIQSFWYFVKTDHGKEYNNLQKGGGGDIFLHFLSSLWNKTLKISLVGFCLKNMVCRQELHTSFSFLKFLEGNDIYKLWKYNYRKRYFKHWICLSNVLIFKECELHSYTVEVLYNVFQETRFLNSMSRKPLHGGKYCFMGLWLGLLSVMYEKTLKLGVGKDVITKWSFIMFQNAKFWGVLINSLQIHSYSIAFVHIDLTCIKNNSFGGKIEIWTHCFSIKNLQCFLRYLSSITIEDRWLAP